MPRIQSSQTMTSLRCAMPLDDDKSWSIECADCLDFMASLPEASVDLVFGSPPYLSARTYGIGAQRDCLEWVEWMLEVTTAAMRVSKGLVLWVVAGTQKDLCYQPGPEGLAWEWWNRGGQLWRPVIWHKVDDAGGGTGIPGSGGKQWLRNDWEYILAFKREGWLPWADNTAMGTEPVYAAVGGDMGNRTQEWGGKFESIGNRAVNGKRKKKPDEKYYLRRPDGSRMDGEGRKPLPKIANPGNFLEFPAVVNARVGGGHMGNSICHESEAPFPEALATFFVRSFCQPGRSSVRWL